MDDGLGCTRRGFTSSMHLSCNVLGYFKSHSLFIFEISRPVSHWISLFFTFLLRDTHILTSSCAALASYMVSASASCFNPLQSFLDMLAVLFSGSSMGRFGLSQEKKQRFISFRDPYILQYIWWIVKLNSLYINSIHLLHMQH